MTPPIEDFETGLFLEGEEWLAFWKPDMDPDEWEESRAEAGRVLIPAPAPKRETSSLAQKLTQKAKSL